MAANISITTCESSSITSTTTVSSSPSRVQKKYSPASCLFSNSISSSMPSVSTSSVMSPCSSPSIANSFVTNRSVNSSASLPDDSMYSITNDSMHSTCQSLDSTSRDSDAITHSSSVNTTPTTSLVSSYLSTSLVSPVRSSSSPLAITLTSFSLSPNCISSTSSPATLPKLVEKLLAPSDVSSPKSPQIPADPTFTIASSQSSSHESPIIQDSVSSVESPQTSSLVSHPSCNAEQSFSPVNTSASSADTVQDFPSVATVNAQNVTSIPLWKRKVTPTDHNSNFTEFEVDAVGLQHVLTFLISKTDTLSAQCEELKSKNEIMQNSIISTIGSNLDHKFVSLRNDFLTSFENLDGESTIRQCTEICNEMNDDITKRLDEVLKDNDDMRKVWDTHMGRIRHRVHSVIDDEDDVLTSDDDEDRPVHLSPTDIKLNRLKAEIKSLQAENHKLDVRLIEVEQYSRRESLVFSGIPANIAQKDLELKVLEIMYHLGYQGSTQLTHDDISACHRLWQPPSSRNPARVIVKFTNRKVVEWTLAHKSNLAKVRENLGLNLEVSESICAMNSESLKICKGLLDEGRIVKYYTRNGFPKVVVGEYDAPVKINHPNVLRERFEGIPIS